MQTIPGLRSGLNLHEYLVKEFQVEAVVGNLDTLTLFCNNLPPGIRRLEQLMGERKWWIEPNEWGFKIILQQPNNETLDWLGKKQEELASEPWMYQLKVSAIDLGLEFITSRHVELQDHCRQYLTLKWQRKPAKNRYITTDYWDEGDATRNVIGYSTEPSRHPDYVNSPCYRLELSFRNKGGSVKANGLNKLRQIPTEEIIDLFQKHKRWVDEDALEEKVRREVSERLKSPHTHTSNDMNDRWYDRGYLSRRIKFLYLRYGVNRVKQRDWRSLKLPTLEIIGGIEGGEA